MEKQYTLAMIVPGPTDRAFYKRFFKLIADIIGVGYDDLDRADRRKEKDALLAQIYKPMSQLRETRFKKTSAILLSNEGAKLAIVIIPSEGDLTGVAAALIGYQMGLSKPSVDIVIVAEDAEDKTPEERLRALRDSLASQEKSLREVWRGNLISKGHYYEEYVLDTGLRLLLVVQGIEEIKENISTLKPIKHAIEDYIIYVKGDVISNVVNSCSFLKQVLGEGRVTHKKLAQLVAIIHCYADIVEFIYRNILADDVKKLVAINDALNRIKELTRQLLYT